MMLVRGSKLSTALPKSVFPKLTPPWCRRFGNTTPNSEGTPQTASSTVPRGKDRKPTTVKEGDKLHGFDVIAITPVPERNLRCIELKHTATGAKHLHIECDDTNNVFSVTFKTTPKDSTGVAHILEHTTLCGSEKYPVRDPFFNMLKRSLNTYMNAYTAADHTTYPFSTQNEKDYNNLLSVYLDATFFPKLDEHDFRQEGHRLEFANMEEPTSALKFKGVVFNEMKGVLSDPSNVFSEHLQQRLFPTNTYSYNSGGEPKHIPQLTYQNLKNFHKAHYHPSNAWFFTYGDLPLEPKLQFLEKHALSHFKHIDTTYTEVPDEKRWDKPVRVDLTGPPTPMAADPEKQTKVSVAYLQNKTMDSYETFLLGMLGALLTRGPNSPFYKALIDSNIGLDYAPGTGFDSYIREGWFSVGLNGIKPDDVDKVLGIVQETLEQAAKDGFEDTRIESVLHQIEFHQKNITSNFGMSLTHNLTSSWIHGGSPTEQLLLNETIARFRADLAKGPLFQNLIKKYFLENQHQLTLVMNPDENYQQKETENERKNLQEIRDKLSQGEIDKIVDEAKILKKRQDEKPDVNLLPTLHVSDIADSEPKVSITNGKVKGTPVQWVEQPTNGITYFRAIVDLEKIPSDLRMYLPLFTNVLTEMGAGNYDHRQLSQEIELYTSGIDASIGTTTHPSDLDYSTEDVFFHAGCLDRNLDKMFDLIRIIFLDPKFENEDLLRTLISQRMASMQDSITSSGNAYAKCFAASYINSAHYLKEMWGGMTQVSFMQTLSNQEHLDDIITKLKTLASHILNKRNMRVSIVSEGKSFGNIEQKLGNFLDSIPGNPSSTPVAVTPVVAPVLEHKKTFFPLPSTVNFVATCSRTVPYTHEDSAKLQILTRLLQHMHLHTEIREKGGAYGSSASNGGGVLSFTSYRDPNITATLDVISKSAGWLKTNSFSDQDISEAKIAVFSDLDSPVPPSRKGLSEFSRSITYEMRQKRRQELLATTRQDLLQMSEKYLENQDNTIVAVLGNEQHTEKLKEKGWHIKPTTNTATASGENEESDEVD